MQQNFYTQSFENKRFFAEINTCRFTQIFSFRYSVVQSGHVRVIEESFHVLLLPDLNNTQSMINCEDRKSILRRGLK